METVFEIFRLSILSLILTLNLKSEFSRVFALIPYPSDPNNNTFLPFQLFFVKSFVPETSNALTQNSLVWCPHTDSNREPIDYKSIALPIEL